ncbi:hypothetical protein EUA93_06960 [Nocardioides oleivorans]|uniref:DUF559 domain-containing protein n=1 Tax=Nocardioides oleivorans TaxID=273676 RepID=A0A4Q2RYE0_9ACTN|nr:hypothetical protein [Nocardioides oleivorans]RYB94108.1 hypothetical protein EUA93_06960 [Nocardioides oleivorans]
MARHRWDPVAPRVVVVHPRRVGDGLTPGQARGPGWVRTGSSLYVPSSVDRDVAQQRIVEESACLPATAAITGWAACLLHGAAWCDGLATDATTRLPIAVAVGTRGGVRRRPGRVISFEALPEWEVCERYGVRVTRVERATFDEMRRHDCREALVVLEAVLAARVTSLQRFAAYADAHRSARRSEVVRWALLRARGRARSPMEVRVRTIAEEDAGWPRLLVNRVVQRLDGASVGEVDLVAVDLRAAIEVDGADHRSSGQQAWDITKEEGLRDVGFEVARATGAQALDPSTLAARLVAVRLRAEARAPESDERRWRLRGVDDDLEAWLTEREETATFYENLPDAVDLPEVG